jgi:hypothetical protein
MQAERDYRPPVKDRLAACARFVSFREKPLVSRVNRPYP